jgi:hypothetical protein
MTPSNLLEWIASLPFEVLIIVLYLPALVIALLGTLLVRWVFDDWIAQGSAVGPTKAQYMAEVYSALLGFLVVVAYAQFDDTRTSVRQEVEHLRLIERLAGQFAPSAQAAVERAVSDYARAVVTDEWPRMAFGDESPTVDAAITGMLDALPAVGDDTSVYAALTVLQMRGLVQDVVAARADRVTATPDSNVSDLLSGVLLLVTLLAVSIGWFLRGPSVVVHLILIAFMVTTFLSLIVLAVELIYPFAGGLTVPSDEFQRLMI